MINVGCGTCSGSPQISTQFPATTEVPPSLVPNVHSYGRSDDKEFLVSAICVCAKLTIFIASFIFA